MEKSVKLSCRHVWKLFGHGAGDFLSNSTASPSFQEIENAGLVGAVRDANIDVYDGEIFVIMGLSGSGKSTLVRCLSRLVEPTAGELIFEGVDLRKVSAKEMIEIRRHKLGMVFQHFALLPHLTVLDNVAFPLDVQGMPKEEREEKAQKVIELVGLAGRELNYPRELSGGQQQRVGIARSLAVEPELWFLDEPFSALDPLIRREMQDEFLRLQSMLHKTIVFITHDFDEAIRLADRIAIMKDGEIIQVATPEELVLNPATSYVEEFTRHIPRAKVLTVSSIMSSEKVESDHNVYSNSRIEEIADAVVTGGKTICVVDQDDTPVGSLTPKAIIDVLIGREVSR
ncbi:MAG: betaine/proline/choline family ABC transporter ATP-binding protein [Hyphomicrobiales bacterium]